MAGELLPKDGLGLLVEHDGPGPGLRPREQHDALAEVDVVTPQEADLAEAHQGERGQPGDLAEGRLQRGEQARLVGGAQEPYPSLVLGVEGALGEAESRDRPPKQSPEHAKIAVDGRRFDAASLSGSAKGQDLGLAERGHGLIQRSWQHSLQYGHDLLGPGDRFGTLTAGLELEEVEREGLAERRGTGPFRLLDDQAFPELLAEFGLGVARRLPRVAGLAQPTAIDHDASLPTPTTVPLEPPDRHRFPPQRVCFMKLKFTRGTRRRRRHKISRVQH